MDKKQRYAAEREERLSYCHIAASTSVLSLGPLSVDGRTSFRTLEGQFCNALISNFFFCILASHPQHISAKGASLSAVNTILRTGLHRFFLLAPCAHKHKPASMMVPLSTK